MGRVVRSVSNRNFGVNQNNEDQYIDRVVKYVPAESLSAFIGIQSIAPEKTQGHWVEWIAFFVLLIGTPLYIKQVAKEKDGWKLHAAIATLGFCVWSFAISNELTWGPQRLIYAKVDNANFLAGILIILFPFMVGLLIPRAKSN